MRTIEYTTQFKKDLKRERKGQHQATVDADVTTIGDSLADGQPLAQKHRDHALTGNWKDHRKCHVKPDLLLIYKLIDADDPELDPGSLHLVRLGSHSELRI